MLNIALISSVAKSALVGAVATKVVDTLISTKVTNKIEHNKWLRNTKLELFSSLVDDLFLLNQENFDNNISNIRRNIAKIILVFNDRKLSNRLEKFLDDLQKHKEQLSPNEFKSLNNSLINYLKTNIKI